MRISKELKKQIKSSLVAFRSIVLENNEERELPPAFFHHQLSDLLLNGEENVAVEMFRESGKSSYVLRAFPLHCLVYPSYKLDFIVLIKQNQRAASNKLKDIINEYMSNPVLQHNLVDIKEQSAMAFSVNVRDEFGNVRNVRIESYGKGSSIRGLSSQDRRPSIVILDDIQDKEDSRSDTTLTADWDWFLSDIKFLGKFSRIFLIGNNLGEKCVIEKVFNNAEELGFKGIRIPVILNGKPTWAEKESLEDIEKEKEAYTKLGKIDLWQQEKMCIAVSEESKIFQEEDYRYYAPSKKAELIANCNVYATLDPASSNNPESCYRAVVVTGVDKDNNWFILDTKYGRWDSAEMINIIFNVVRDYRLKDFYIERGWYEQVIKPFLIQEMKKRNVFFNVTPLEHAKQGSKLERIKMLQPRFKAHSIYFPDYAEWLAEFKAELAGVTKDAIKSEYIDIVDALAMAEQVALPPVNAGREYRDIAMYNYRQQNKSLFEIAGF